MPTNVRLCHDPYVGFDVERMQLPHEGLAAKIAGKEMTETLFVAD